LIRITVEGAPIAKKRPRFVRRGKYVATYNPQETEEGRFLLLAMGQIPGALKGPLKVECEFFMPRPGGHYGTGRNAGVLKASAPAYHTGKPDADNLAKFCLDVLNGAAWKDDSQIVEMAATKKFADDGCPRTVIKIQEMQ
jgi:crossover junction endodeoxyribonuclease RusA